MNYGVETAEGSAVADTTIATTTTTATEAAEASTIPSVTDPNYYYWYVIKKEFDIKAL